VIHAWAAIRASLASCDKEDYHSRLIVDISSDHGAFHSLRGFQTSAICHYATGHPRFSAAARSVSIKVGGDATVSFESGGIAQQADGACLASSGSTHVLATAVCNSSVVVEDEEGMLPLQVVELVFVPLLPPYA
jgi:hypothetical protein